MLEAGDDFDPQPDAPQAPGDDMCCGSGCEPCVWDTYQIELADYRVRLAAWLARQESV